MAYFRIILYLRLVSQAFYKREYDKINMTFYILNAEVSTNSEVLLLNQVEQHCFKDPELSPKQ